jgi:hypothetical protein
MVLWGAVDCDGYLDVALLPGGRCLLYRQSLSPCVDLFRVPFSRCHLHFLSLLVRVKDSHIVAHALMALSSQWTQ